MDRLIERVCLIVPCYNEAEVLPEFFRRLDEVAGAMPDVRIETLYVDDGSRDGTSAALLARAAEDPQMRVLVLSRNYGHQAAITAGLDHCFADAAVVLDADLQDPPELVADIVREIRNGADVVHMVRTQRLGDSAAKRWSARVFYAYMRRWGVDALPENAGDFKGLSRRAVDALRHYPERVRFLRGLIAELGFCQVQLAYARDPRHAGRSKYPWRRVVRFATDAVVSHSPMPMRLVLGIGGISVAGAFLAPLALAGTTALLAFLVMLYGGLALMGLGLVGEYMVRILTEVKRRPMYIVQTRVNFGRDAEGLARMPAEFEGHLD